MPQPVLKAVAALLVLIALGSFVIGAVTAPARGRLPGERLQPGDAAPIEATDATPLGDERIEGPPPPKELTEEEKAELEEEKRARAEEVAAARAQAEAEKAAAPAILPAQPPADKVGDLLDSVTPPPEEPPH